MRPDTDTLIAGLVGELSPTQPIRLRHGAFVFAGAAGMTLLAVTIGLGVRTDLATGTFDPIFLVANGLFLVLAISSAVTAIVMFRPQMGSRHLGWVWAAAMVAVLPASAVLMQILQPDSLKQQTPDGLTCLITSASLGLIATAGLTAWLRRGAPTSPERAGLLAGIAGGAMGAFSFAFHCPCDDLFHVGVWHASAVLLGALVGRFGASRFLRW